MEFNVYDLYSDASINLEHKIGCAGVVLVDRKRDQIVDQSYMVKYNATNNMCEIMGIWMAIYRAIQLLYTENLAFHVNIFSDSKISLVGMREWITNWIIKRRGETLINSTGVVSNQLWYADSYHAIVRSGLKVKFFHQKGHVDEVNPSSLFLADRTFRESNKQSPHMIGLPPSTMAKYNNLVDRTSRDIVNSILAGIPIGNIPYVTDELIIPIAFQFNDEDIALYEKQIHGGLNYPKNFTTEGTHNG